MRQGVISLTKLGRSDSKCSLHPSKSIDKAIRPAYFSFQLSFMMNSPARLMVFWSMNLAPSSVLNLAKVSLADAWTELFDSSCLSVFDSHSVKSSGCSVITLRSTRSEEHTSELQSQSNL